MAIIEHPDSRFNGAVSGIQFADGKAEVDDDTALAFARKGFNAIGIDVRAQADGGHHVGSRLQDAAEGTS